MKEETRKKEIVSIKSFAICSLICVKTFFKIHKGRKRKKEESKQLRKRGFRHTPTPPQPSKLRHTRGRSAPPQARPAGGRASESVAE